MSRRKTDIRAFGLHAIGVSQSSLCLLRPARNCSQSGKRNYGRSLFHLVFVLRRVLAAVALQNKRLMYWMLLEAPTETRSEVIASLYQLGTDAVGVLVVLHA